MNNGDFDLAAWNFAEDFSALEVIGLIFGKFNHELLTWDEKKPVYDRMKKANNSAQKMIEDAFLNADIPFDGDRVVAIPDRDPMNLHSLLNEKARLCPTNDAFAFSAIERFEKARFGRDEIHRWLQAIGATSKYAFALPQQASELAAHEKKQPTSTNIPPNQRAETTHLNIIGGLLCLMLGTTTGGQKGSPYKTQAAIIDALLANYPGLDGIAKSTLESKFAQAKRSISAT